MKGKSSGSVSLKKKTQSSLVQLVSGSNGNTVPLESLLQGEWEPFYGALYLSLDGVNSDNMQAKVDYRITLLYLLYAWSFCIACLCYFYHTTELTMRNKAV